MPATLDEIGLKYGTDKASSHHNYLSFYERFLAPLRDEPLTVLEIGVFQGASLNTWREYFPERQDHRRRHSDRPASSSNPTGSRSSSPTNPIWSISRNSPLTHGPFDLIVEDGSHMWEHQITTLRALFPFLQERRPLHRGGSADELRHHAGANIAASASESCMDFLKRWMDIFVADDLIDLEDRRRSVPAHLWALDRFHDLSSPRLRHNASASRRRIGGSVTGRRWRRGRRRFGDRRQRAFRAARRYFRSQRLCRRGRRHLHDPGIRAGIRDPRDRISRALSRRRLERLGRAKAKFAGTRGQSLADHRLFRADGRRA